MFPSQPVLWKIFCFRNILAEFHRVYLQFPPLLLSLGDGLHERIACKIVSKVS